MSTTTTDPIANRTTPICFTSVHVTACTPPTIVYAMTGKPITRIVAAKFQPRTIERMIDGAAMTMPHESARCIRNVNAASVRVFRSKRFSRYSYAV